MRKREIHSIAHWAMMFLLLMFPLLMVGISVFDKQNYSESELVYTEINFEQLRDGEQTLFYMPIQEGINNGSYIEFLCSDLTINGNDYSSYNRFRVYPVTGTNYAGVFGDGQTTQYINMEATSLSANFKFVAYTISGDFNGTYDLYSISMPVSYKTDVNEWVNAFIDLPINSWYKSLMNVIGVGFTNSSVMNVIYVMPVYILWVFIFDVIVDCFLVIIKLPHKLLNRLSGGENE